MTNSFSLYLFCHNVRGRLSIPTTKKIRTDHEILTRENEKLVRKLDQVIREQQMQPGGKRVIAEEETSSRQEVKVVHFEKFLSS